jgi:hypothetical protein
MKHTKVNYYEKHDGLVLKSKLISNITIKLRLTLPRCLMPSYFKSHKLSRKDVISILDTLPSRDVWLLGLAIGAANLAPSCFRTAYSNVNDILITSKATVIRKIVHKLEHMLTVHHESMLDDSPVSLHHVPALPKHYIPHDDFLRLSQDILPCLNIFEVVEINRLFHYENGTWIAIAFEGVFIFALRAIELEVYNESRREKQEGFATKMPIISVRSQKFKILCDDGALFAVS